MIEGLAMAIAADLEAAGDAAKKEWWESYLKGVIEFHGVPMGGIRSVVHGRVSVDSLDRSALIDLASALLRREVADEKLAGILVLAELVVPPLQPGEDLDRIARMFDEGHIWDWNTCDWLCVKVLGPAGGEGGRQAVDALTSWRDAPSMWRRRASMVGLVPLVSDGDAAIDGLTALTLETCAAHVGDPERFIQTGIGWTLRELSDAAPKEVFGFLQTHREALSREAMRMASARLSDSRRDVLGVKGKRRRR
jgi:3-methyladenine DNA glycosylase AlkD